MMPTTKMENRKSWKIIISSIFFVGVSKEFVSSSPCFSSRCHESPPTFRDIFENFDSTYVTVVMNEEFSSSPCPKNIDSLIRLNWFSSRLAQSNQSHPENVLHEEPLNMKNKKKCAWKGVYRGNLKHLKLSIIGSLWSLISKKKYYSEKRFSQKEAPLSFRRTSWRCCYHLLYFGFLLFHTLSSRTFYICSFEFPSFYTIAIESCSYRVSLRFLSYDCHKKSILLRVYWVTNFTQQTPRSSLTSTSTPIRTSSFLLIERIQQNP